MIYKKWIKLATKRINILENNLFNKLKRGNHII